MTTEQVEAVRNSWKMFRGVDPKLMGDTFYSKLFSETPALRKMFPRDMELQYRKLVDMMNTIISRLDRLKEMNDEISTMAVRHLHYGVRPAHYRLVGKALLWTLQQGLGRDWTPAVAAAWTECYTELANKMLNAAYYE